MDREVNSARDSGATLGKDRLSVVLRHEQPQDDHGPGDTRFPESTSSGDLLICSNDGFACPSGNDGQSTARIGSQIPMFNMRRSNPCISGSGVDLRERRLPQISCWPSGYERDGRSAIGRRRFLRKPHREPTLIATIKGMVYQ